MSEKPASCSRRSLILASLAGAASPALSMTRESTEHPSETARAFAASNESGALSAFSAPAGRIVLSGRVIDPDGMPLHGAFLALSHEQAPVVTDADGLFMWAGTLPENGRLRCSLGHKSGKSCQMRADIWLAPRPDEPYQLHSSQDQDGVWQTSVNLQQAA